MLYSVLCDFYEKIERTTSRTLMTEYLVELFKATPPDLIDKVIYLTQGKLHPDYLGLPELGVAEKLAIKAISRAYGFSESEVEGKLKELGDLGLAAEFYCGRKKQVSLFPNPLTVERVYKELDRMSRASGEGSQQLKLSILAGLLVDAKPKEARYLIRTVLGALRLGIADMTILDALAVTYAKSREARSKVEYAYNITSDLGYIAKILATEGLEGLKKVKVEVGRPIRAMLAERLSSPVEILNKIGGKGAAEYKYDGERVQAHKKGDEVILFSRRLENITAQYPDVCQYIREGVLADEAIVEGEIVAVNVDTGEMLPFQELMHRRRKYDIEKVMKELPVTLFLFDMLYVNGESLLMKPYLERRNMLKKYVRESERLKIAEARIIDDPKELEKFFEEAVEKGCEGLVVKSIAPNSIYRAGAREWLWIKYKRDYKSEMVDTVDLVVVGAYAGKGRRAGTYGALLMAAYDDKEDVFKTVCKVGTGFTDAELANLPDKLAPYKMDHKHPRVVAMKEIAPDYWFTPALVAEILGAEITLSPVHTCGWGKIKPDAGLAIRFPRFIRWRDDKSPEQATTEKELIEMYRSQLKKIT